MVYSTSRNVSFGIREWNFPFGLLKLVFLGSSSRRTIDISSRRGYQIWDCHVSLTSNFLSVWSKLTFYETCRTGQNEGSAKGIDCTRSVAEHRSTDLKGRASKVKHWRSWWYSLDANKYTLSIPLSQTYWNAFEQSLHSDGSLLVRQLLICFGVEINWELLCSNYDLVFQVILPNLFA